jgi:hypothetical protein
MAKKIQIEAFTGKIAHFSKHQTDVMSALIKSYIVADRVKTFTNVNDYIKEQEAEHGITIPWDDIIPEILEIIKTGKKGSQNG